MATQRPNYSTWASVRLVLLNPAHTFEAITQERPSYLPYLLNSIVLVILFAASYGLISKSLEAEIVTAGIDVKLTQAIRYSGLVK